jgi:hypothetical protein
MSAINTFAFQNVLFLPRTGYACACMFAEEAVRQTHDPVVTARWTMETNPDGTRRLVRHWFKNETKV